MRRIKKLALKRINILYKKALKSYTQNLELSRRYIFLLWRIKQKAQVCIPQNIRSRFCRRCFIPWVIGRTISIRIRNGKIILRCKQCGYIKRLPFRD